MPPAHDAVAVGGITLDIITLKYRRSKPHRDKRWCFLRSLEQCIYGGQTGTGAMNKLLGRTSMQAAPICLGRVSVTDGLVTEQEYAFVLQLFRASVADPEARARVRNVSLCPVSVASAAHHKHHVGVAAILLTPANVSVITPARKSPAAKVKLQPMRLRGEQMSELGRRTTPRRHPAIIVAGKVPKTSLKLT